MRHISNTDTDEIPLMNVLSPELKYTPTNAHIKTKTMKTSPVNISTPPENIMSAKNTRDPIFPSDSSLMYPSANILNTSVIKIHPVVIEMGIKSNINLIASLFSPIHVNDLKYPVWRINWHSIQTTNWRIRMITPT